MILSIRTCIYLASFIIGALLPLSCSSSKTVELKIISYNIKHGVGNDDVLNLNRALEVIKKQSPDLVALQEIDHFAQRSDSVDQTSFLANGLNMTGNFGPFMDYQGGAYGMATISAKPIKSTHYLRLPDGIYEPRIAIVQEIEISEDASILFANVHFDWISGDEGEQSRKAQAKFLINYLDQFDLPTVITGDFNCTPESPTMQMFYEAGFSFADKGDDRLSYQGRNKVEIDHLIFRNTESIQITLKQVDLLDEPLVSDHRPLVVLLEVNL